jgi:Vanadium chloroperoxidase N-terminal domain/PAP2 superfamily
MSNSLRNVFAAVALIGSAPTAFGNVIGDWNEKVITFVTAKQMTPPAAERVMAMVHVAMFDAVNSIERRYRPYLTQLPAPPTTSQDAAAAAAASTVLGGLYPQEAAALKASMTIYLASIPDSAAKSEGIKLGETVAESILEARANDGSGAPDAYRPSTKPGLYVPTAIPIASMWPRVKPFAITSPGQFRPEPPVSLQSEQWAADYNELKAFGGKASTKRSARQTEDAHFWLVVGPQAYYPVLLQLAAAKKMSVVDSARFIALMSVARSDAFISVFDAKYHYEFWRPITAIRNGDADDNPGTERDATWRPIDNTPLHPEYPCAHCILAAAMATVVEAVFGTADVPEVTATSPTMPGVLHRWTNVWALSDEVSEARILAGFHYRFSTRIAQDMGRKIGQYVAQNVTRRVNFADSH